MTDDAIERRNGRDVIHNPFSSTSTHTHTNKHTRHTPKVHRRGSWTDGRRVNRLRAIRVGFLQQLTQTIDSGVLSVSRLRGGRYLWSTFKELVLLLFLKWTYRNVTKLSKTTHDDSLGWDEGARDSNGRRSVNERPTVRSSSRIGTGLGRLWEFCRRSATFVRSFPFAALSIHKTNQPTATDPHRDHHPPPPTLPRHRSYRYLNPPQPWTTGPGNSNRRLPSFFFYPILLYTLSHFRFSPHHPTAATRIYFLPLATTSPHCRGNSSVLFLTKYKWNGNQEHSRPPYSYTVPRSQLHRWLLCDKWEKMAKKNKKKKRKATVSVTCARHNRHTRHRVLLLVVNSGSSLVVDVVVVVC